jgi:ethanolamine ammonia-lyase small subunit
MSQHRRPDRLAAHRDPWWTLTTFTQARIGLGRAGGSVPTRALLEFQLAHARARDAVHYDLDDEGLAARLAEAGFESLRLHSAAPDRRTFIARPDLGRVLDAASRRSLEQCPARSASWDVVFLAADGLSARAVERHTIALLEAVRALLAPEDWRVAPVCVVKQGRVAVGDEIGAQLNAALTVMLIGERPGLSSPDSLGIYLTWSPLPGRSNAERNCISNVRPPEGLPYALAAHKLVHLMRDARRCRKSGVDLKENAPLLLDGSGTEVFPQSWSCNDRP